MHISTGCSAAERLRDQQAAQLQAVQNAVSASNSATPGASTGTDPFPSLLQASPAVSAAPAFSAAPSASAPGSLSALLAAQEQNGASDLAGNLSALDKLLSGVTGKAAAPAPTISATA